MSAAARKKPRALIGTSGWSYRHWIGPVYPEDARTADHLSLYACDLATVEINNTFYRLPTPKAVRHWRDQAPSEFTFAVKASRFITHRKKLKDPVSTFDRFFATVSHLDDRLGPILFQLPPRWHANVERLAAFLDAVPRELACAFEFRDQSWYCDEVLRCLEAHGAALCIHDFGGELSPTDVTARFVYLRFHGVGERYAGLYGKRRLRKWAERIGGWLDDGRDVYAYFNNDAEGHAFRDALTLKSLVEDRS